MLPARRLCYNAVAGESWTLQGEIMARILFVDDDLSTLETLTRAVQLFGHLALQASTGQAALNAVTRELPDLVFTDMMLPDMDGIDFIENMHRQTNIRQIPVYVLSASPEIDSAERAEAVGAKGYLNKPIRLQTLMNIIQSSVPA
jgi:CheY-like chemotaxis protein